MKSKRFKSFISNHTRPSLMIILILILFGVISIVITRAASSSISVETEKSNVRLPATKTTNDPTASSGGAIRFGAVIQPPPSGDEPTRENTGLLTTPTQVMSAQELTNTRTCNNKVITEKVDIITTSNSKWNIENCWFRSSFTAKKATGGLSEWTISNSEFNGGFWINGSVKMDIDRTAFISKSSGVWSAMNVTPINNEGSIEWTKPTPMPITVTNSYLYVPILPKPYHTEAFASFGYPDGMSFSNTAFVLQGPLDGTQTGAINMHGNNTVLDNCYFYYEGGRGANYTIYFAGINNILKNSRIENGTSTYIYPHEDSQKAIYQNNKDYRTGAPI